jgi:hypothetical protein
VNEAEEREAITAAMARLFAGTPMRSTGSLDIVTLAQEAGLKRNRLTHRHTDLKDRFYTARAARDGAGQRQVKLTDQIFDLQRRYEEPRREARRVPRRHRPIRPSPPRPHRRERQPQQRTTDRSI